MKVNIQEVLNKKNQLKTTETKITTIDGITYIEKEGKKEQCKERSNGYVIDTSPDKIAVEIIDHLYLGSQDAVSDKEYLQSLSMKHILCVAPMIPSLFPNDFDYKIVELLDIPSFDIKNHIHHCLEYIDECLKRNENVICHCNAGVSRSPTVIIAYLIEYKKMSFKNAFELVKQKRSSIRPNDGFLLYLKNLDQLSLIMK